MINEAVVYMVVLEEETVLSKIILTYLMSPVTLMKNSGIHNQMKWYVGSRKTRYIQMILPIISNLPTVQSIP